MQHQNALLHFFYITIRNFSHFPFQNFLVLGLAMNYLIYMDFCHEQLRWEQKIKSFFNTKN